MKILLVCQRDGNCPWAFIADERNSPRGQAAQERHHSVHDRKRLRKATPAFRAEPAGKEASPSGSPRLSCACCALNVFMPHGGGHIGPIAKSVAA